MERGTSARAIQSVVDTVYAPCACSPLGKLKKVSQPYAPGGTVYWTTYTYDAIGRTLSVQQPDGASTTTYSYSGNQTTVTDPAGNAKTLTSDSLGNLTTVLEPNPAGGTLTTSYTYDWMNHVSQVTMTRGSTTQNRTFAYNDQGDLTSSVNPESGTASYYYNANHTLWYKHDANGQDTVYTYDSALRVTLIQRYPTGKSNAEDTCGRVTNYYNTNPFSTTFSLNTVNRLAAVAYGSWGTPTGCLTGENQHAWYQMYSYHAAGVVTSKQLAVNGAGAVTASYTYDSAGRTLTSTYPVAIAGVTQNDTFTSGFDGMGRPVSLTGSETPSALTWVQNVQYDFAGHRSSMQYLVSPTSTGYTTEAKGYNANGQLASMAWSGGSSPVTGSLQYSYSATQNTGQITQVVDTVSGETIVYQYDSLKRLMSSVSTPNTGSSTAAWTQTFQYDGFGNLTAKVLNGTTTSIAVNAATNQLSSASYDYNGNMTSGVGATFTFDVGNRILSAAEVSGGFEYYGYAPDNKRIYKKLTSGAEEYTFYGGRGERLGVYNLTSGTASALRTNVWFAGKLISENGSAVFQDRVGTNRGSGSRFYPYGDEITSTSNDREKFATYTRDGYTGLDYADQRFYASAYGRFDSPDPYQAGANGSGDHNAPQSWNRYAYTQGDPINFYDSRGLFLDAPDPPFDPGPAPGPAPGPTPFGTALRSLGTAVDAIERRVGVSPKCQNDLDALSAGSGKEIDLGTIQDALAITNFLNGNGSTLPVSALYGPGAEQAGAVFQAQQDAQFGPGQTIGNLFSRNPAGLTADTVLLGTTIFINPPLISGLLAINEGLLLHESLHELGLVDTDIQQYLGITVDGNNTANISLQLRKDCLGGKGNN
jgi:RHS repeat-associated protein